MECKQKCGCGCGSEQVAWIPAVTSKRGWLECQTLQDCDGEKIRIPTSYLTPTYRWHRSMARAFTLTHVRKFYAWSFNVYSVSRILYFNTWNWTNFKRRIFKLYSYIIFKIVSGNLRYTSARWIKQKNKK